MLRSILPALVGLLLIGCSHSADNSGDRPESQADRQAVVEANNQFALDLYGKLSASPGNLVVSPYSISTALAMTAAGAKGQTAEQMNKTLHFRLPPDRLHPAFASLLQATDQEQLRVANALWAQQGEAFVDRFLKIVETDYRAGLNAVDFGQPDATRQTINAWVAKKTGEKIPELLPPGSIGPESTLVLTNAIYFQGKWKIAFAKKGTYNEPFFTKAGESVQVPMMHQLDQHPYFDGETFQALKLNYENERVSMVVLLPRQVDGLPALEKSLSGEKLSQWLKEMANQRVEVTLPRFKLRGNFKLKETLAELGMPAAFAPGADFTGIVSQGQLFIGNVIHEAMAEVDEEGTVAAAATAVQIVKSEPGAYAGPRAIFFRADRPFLFLIRDEKTGSILFLGRVTNPVER